MLQRTLKAFYSLAVAREKAAQRSLLYLSKIQLSEGPSKNDVAFTCNGKALKFGHFDALTAPNGLIGNLIMLEWKKQANLGQKLDIPLDIKAILAKSSDLSNNKLTRDEVYDEILKYLSTDTLLFWDEESSPLREWQNEVWSEALAKFSNKLNLPPFQITDGLFQLRQDEKISNELFTFMDSLSAYNLAAFDYAVKSLKSVILSWGLLKGVYSAEEVVKISLLELQYQGNRWGRRPEYHDLNEAELLRKVTAAKLFID